MVYVFQSLKQINLRPSRRRKSWNIDFVNCDVTGAAHSSAAAFSDNSRDIVSNGKLHDSGFSTSLQLCFDPVMYKSNRNHFRSISTASAGHYCNGVQATPRPKTITVERWRCCAAARECSCGLLRHRIVKATASLWWLPRALFSSRRVLIGMLAVLISLKISPQEIASVQVV